MYFIKKYNVFNKHIINATTTPINTFEFGQREVISVFTLVTNKGEHSIIIIIKQCKEKMWNYIVKLVRKRIKHR
jgi:hypothetical protein